MYVVWSRRKTVIIFPILTMLAMLGITAHLHPRTSRTHTTTCNCSPALALGVVEALAAYAPDFETGLLTASLL